MFNKLKKLASAGVVSAAMAFTTVAGVGMAAFGVTTLMPGHAMALDRGDNGKDSSGGQGENEPSSCGGSCGGSGPGSNSVSGDGDEPATIALPSRDCHATFHSNAITDIGGAVRFEGDGLPLEVTAKSRGNFLPTSKHNTVSVKLEDENIRSLRDCFDRTVPALIKHLIEERGAEITRVESIGTKEPWRLNF